MLVSRVKENTNARRVWVGRHLDSVGIPKRAKLLYLFVLGEYT